MVHPRDDDIVKQGSRYTHQRGGVYSRNRGIPCRHETLQDAVAVASGADDLVLEIKCVVRDLGDLPVTILDHLQMPVFVRPARSLIEMWHAFREQEQSS